MVDAGLKEVVTNVERAASGNLWLVESPTDVAVFIELDDGILVVVDVVSCFEAARSIAIGKTKLSLRSFTII